jgi:hypothetical protein
MRGRCLRLCFLGASAMLGLAVGGTEAFAARSSSGTTCVYDPFSHVVDVQVAPNYGVQMQVADGAITFDFELCEAATVVNTALIRVRGSADAAEGVTAGAVEDFAPGFGAERGLSEIEWDIDLGGNTSGVGGEGIVLGTSANAGLLVFGERGAAVNRDADLDLAVRNVDDVSLNGGSPAGSPPLLLSGRGGHGTGGPTSVPLTLIGSFEAPNVMKGGLGNDRLADGGRDDVLQGGEGDDVLLSRDGSDTLRGGPGDDVLRSTDQRFELIGPDEVFGGQGRDAAELDPDDVRHGIEASPRS